MGKYSSGLLVPAEQIPFSMIRDLSNQGWEKELENSLCWLSLATSGMLENKEREYRLSAVEFVRGPRIELPCVYGFNDKQSPTQLYQRSKASL